MASTIKRSQFSLTSPVFLEQTTTLVSQSSQEQPLSSQWPEWAAVFPQTEAEILGSIWPVGNP